MDIQGLVNAQHNFFHSNRTKDPNFRIEQLKKFGRVVKENEDLLYETIYKDFLKSRYDTYLFELGLFYHELKLAIKKTKRWSRRKKVSTNLANFPATSYIIPEPLGVSLIIGAWNFPYLLTLIPAVSALAAGNTVVLKPSELSANTSQAMAQIVNANFEEEYFKVVEGGVDETTDLLNQKFDKIFFTGSTAVGKIIYQAAAKNLTPVTLELSGKSPCFVFADCNLKVTAQRIVWGKFSNAGQACVAPDFILVDKSIENEFLSAITTEIEKNYPKSDDIWENYTQIINSRNFDRLTGLIEKGKVYCGGSANKEKRFIEPTILHDVSFNDTVMEDEIFGPVLPVISFTDLEKTIQELKERPKPLACYVYSKNRKIINQILSDFSFGGGGINDSLTHLGNSNLPFGGVGASGIGNYHGEAGFRTFSHYKSIIDKPYWYESGVKYKPYTKGKIKFLRRLFE